MLRGGGVRPARAQLPILERLPLCREPRAELVAIGGDGALRHRPLTTPIRRQRQKVRETLLVESRET